MSNESLEIYMQKAIEETYDGIHKGDGGPFGSVVVKDGEIIGSGHNMVSEKMIQLPMENCWQFVKLVKS